MVFFGYFRKIYEKCHICCDISKSICHRSKVFSPFLSACNSAKNEYNIDKIGEFWNFHNCPILGFSRGSPPRVGWSKNSEKKISELLGPWGTSGATCRGQLQKSVILPRPNLYWCLELNYCMQTHLPGMLERWRTAHPSSMSHFASLLVIQGVTQIVCLCQIFNIFRYL